MAKKRYTADETPELELTPMMNLIMMLIPFLLLSAEFIQFGVINVNAPRSAAGGGAGEEEEEKKEEPLNLTITITHKGFYVAASGGVLGSQDPEAVKQAGPTLPINAAGDYPYDDLTRVMIEVKDKRPEETKIFINVAPEIKYDALIKTMDATRETPDHSRILFPDVALAQGFVE
ncbi:MAG: hypothetical protein Kow0090_04900 [Myxococcota bacterium]